MRNLMITLKTLSLATAQEVFDQVSNHLVKQNKKSVKIINQNSYCSYRGEDGLSCAGGCLIGEDEYKPEFENCDWIQLVNAKRSFPENHADLIRELQIVHDFFPPEIWTEKLKEVAKNFDLECKL